MNGRSRLCVFVVVIAAGVFAASCSDDDASSSSSTATPDDVTQGVFVHDLLSTETFGVVYAEGDESIDRAAWRQDGTLRRWDFVQVEDGAPVAGAFITVNRVDDGTTGQRCLWTRSTRVDGKFALICGESTHGIGPVLGTWELLLTGRADNAVGDRNLIGEQATCWQVSDRTIQNGSVCLAADGVPLVLEALRASHPVTASSFEAIERMDAADVELSLPVIMNGVTGSVELTQLGLPPSMFDGQ